MKKTWIILPFVSLTWAVNAQENLLSTPATDTTYNLQEVVVETARKARPQITKLDVPMKYMPLSVSGIEAQSLELRGIRNIQDAVRFMPGIRISFRAFASTAIISMIFRSPTMRQPTRSTPRCRPGKISTPPVGWNLPHGSAPRSRISLSTSKRAAA